MAEKGVMGGVLKLDSRGRWRKTEQWVKGRRLFHGPAVCRRMWRGREARLEWGLRLPRLWASFVGALRGERFLAQVFGQGAREQGEADGLEGRLRV